MANPMFQIETKAGTPVRVGNATLTPFSQSVQIGIPGKPIGVIYNRPVSVLATTPDGEEQVIQVPDVTRRIQVSLLAVAFAWAMLLVFYELIMKRRSSHD